MRFETSDELLNFVENWVGFGGPGYDYDARGLLLLLRASLRNMNKHFIEGDFEDLEGFFSDEERGVLSKLLHSCR